MSMNLPSGRPGGLDYVRHLDGRDVRVRAFYSAREASGLWRACSSGRKPRSSLPGETRENWEIQQANRLIDTRRYAIHNDLNAHLTFTVAPPVMSIDKLKHEMALAFRAARELRGSPFPFKWVTEGGRESLGNERPHVHALVPRSVVDLLNNVWRYGTVFDEPKPTVDDQRSAAKYLVKNLRYGQGGREIRTGPGFTPEPEILFFRGVPAALDFLEEGFGGAPTWTNPIGPRPMAVGFTAFWDYR